MSLKEMDHTPDSGNPMLSACLNVNVSEFNPNQTNQRGAGGKGKPNRARHNKNQK